MPNKNEESFKETVLSYSLGSSDLKLKDFKDSDVRSLVDHLTRLILQQTSEYDESTKKMKFKNVIEQAEKIDRKLNGFK